MKIYQMHEYSGEWEDFRDIIVGSYLRKERAEEKWLEYELKEKELRKACARCGDCPFMWEDEENLDTLIAQYSDYCSKKSLEKAGYSITCGNYTPYHDNATYKIIEVEVEE